MAPDVSTEECFRLARAMTRKNSAAGIPLDEICATGWGRFQCAKIALRCCNLRGRPGGDPGLRRGGQARGAVLVADSDTAGTVANRKGLDVAELIRIKG